MSRSLAPLVFFLAACGGGGLQLPFGDDGEDGLAIAQVSPAWGHALGGAEVVVQGGPFADGAQAWFGGEEAEVLDVQEGAITVRLPPHAAGEVAVQVSSGRQGARREGAFTYHADATGLAGAFGAVEWYTLLGSYWQAGSASFGQAWWGLIEPQDLAYADVFGGVVDGCVSGLRFPAMEALALGVQGSALTDGAHTLSGERAPDGFYEAAMQVAPAPEASWDLLPLEGGALEGLAVEDLAWMPEPPALLEPQLDGAQVARLAVDELALGWTPQGEGPLYVLAVLHDAELNELEAVGCLAADDGAFAVPPELWTREWPEEGWLFLYLGAAGPGGGALPHNGARSEVVGLSWSLGAALTRGG